MYKLLGPSEKINFWLAVFTAGMFLFTGISTCMTRQIIKQFEIENAPLIQLQAPWVKNIKPFERYYLMDQLKNYGKYPVKVIFDATANNVQVDPPTFDTIYSSHAHPEKLRTILCDSLDLKGFGPVLTPEHFYAFETGRESVYYWGYFIFENEVTHKDFEYDFMIKSGADEIAHFIIDSFPTHISNKINLEANE